jgi:hypothetical protein
MLNEKSKTGGYVLKDAGQYMDKIKERCMHTGLEITEYLSLISKDYPSYADYDVHISKLEKELEEHDWD